MTVKLKQLFPVLIASSLLLLGGCACKKPECLEPVLAEPTKDEESLDAKGFPIGEGRTTKGMLPVYYDFDKSDIRADQQPRMKINADFMGMHGDVNVRIEGNTDSRGTNEYNMALGERRALSAQKYLIGLGVQPSRLTTVSYGEERALLTGKDEMSWAQNRRSDFVVE